MPCTVRRHWLMSPVVRRSAGGTEPEDHSDGWPSGSHEGRGLVSNGYTLAQDPARGRRGRSFLVDASGESTRNGVETAERLSQLMLALATVATRIGSAPSQTAVFETLGAELRELGLSSLVALRAEGDSGFVIEHSSIDSKVLDAVRVLTGLSFQGYQLHPDRWPADVSEPVLAGTPLFVTDAMPVALAEVPMLPPNVIKAALRLVGWSATTPSVHAPLVDQNKVIGLLAVWGGDLRPEDLPAFTAFAGQLATAIANARLQEALRQQMVELSRVQLQLLQSVRLAAVGEIAAHVAHEINNPLTSVLGHLDLVLDDLPADAPERESVVIAQREAARIAQVVKALIAQAQGPARTLEPTAINDVVESAMLLLRQRLERVEVEVSLERSLPPVVADVSELRQVILNLLSNALDATPDGGRVAVSTQAIQYHNQRFVELAVTDSGPGLAPGDVDRVFEPFFTTKGSGERPGLGLAVSKRIIDQHGGSIQAETVPGGGSRFTVRLPAQ